jgi:hypothetical protein
MKLKRILAADAGRRNPGDVSEVSFLTSTAALAVTYPA